MAKVKFQINRKTLIEEANEEFALTRVPNSHMEYYVLIGKDDVVSQNNKTIVVEWDAEKQVDVLSGSYMENGKLVKPTLQEAIAARENPPENVKHMTAAFLEEGFYNYDEIFDPKRKARIDAERKRIAEQTKQNQTAEADKTLHKEKGSQKFAKDKADEQTMAERQKATSKEKGNKKAAEQIAEPSQPKTQYFSKQQFREIRKGVRQRLEYRLYSNIHLNPKQMKELRLALKAGIDISRYNSPFITAEHMKEIRIGYKKGVQFNLENLDHSLYNAGQIHELRLGFEKNLEVKRFLNPAYSAEQMKELRLGLQAGFDTRGYESLHFSAEQMRTVRLDMLVNNISEVLQRFFENVKEWLNDRMERAIEHLKSEEIGRLPRTTEQIYEDNMNEAVADIKEVLIQSELLPESAYENKNIDKHLREQIEETLEYASAHPEQINQVTDEAAMDICVEHGVEIEPVYDKITYVKTTEEAVDEALEQMYQQQYERDMEMEDWEMIQ